MTGTQTSENELEVHKTPRNPSHDICLSPGLSITPVDLLTQDMVLQYSHDTIDETQMKTVASQKKTSPPASNITPIYSTGPQGIVDRARRIHKIIVTSKSVTRVSKSDIQKLALEIVELAKQQQETTLRKAPADEPPTSNNQTKSAHAIAEHEASPITNYAIREELTIMKAEIDMINSTIKEEFENLTGKLTAQRVATDMKDTLQRPTYSEQVKKPALNLPRNNPAIVATVANAQTGAEALQTFKHRVSFRECSYAPARIRPVTNNRLRIEFENEKQRDETLIRLNSGGPISAEPARTLLPMAILKGIHKDTPPQELAQIIVSQNPTVGESLTDKDEMQLCFVKRNNRNENLYNAVFKCPPAAWQAAMRLGRLNIEHQRVHVSEHSPFKQCLSCLQYGHTKIHCKATIRPCSHCADTTHNYKQCPHRRDKPPQCYNCKIHNERSATKFEITHAAINPNCPKIKAAKLTLHHKINYAR